MTQKESLSIKKNTGFKMEQFTKGSGKTTCDMGKEPRFGQMERGTRGSGGKIKRMGKASSGMLMETSLRESGKMTRLMDLEFIRI